MLFNCKDTSFFSKTERFLIFFCIFACKIKSICANALGKSPILGVGNPYFACFRAIKIRIKIIIHN